MSHSSLNLRIAKPDPISSDLPRFVVAGQAGTASGDVKLYEWHREKGDMRLAGLQTDAGQVRAIAWSPSPTHRNLVACGLSTGRTLLLNLSPKTLSAPPSHHSSSSSLPSATISVLPVKHVRATTCIAFSPIDHNYIATGYEKHRSDYSLLIWDLSTALGAVAPDGDANWQRPLDRLEVTNPLAREATRLNPSEPRHIQHYCPSETVNDLAFLPNSYSLLASANSKSIRLYDLRAPGPSGGTATPRDPSSANALGASAQWLTRAVNGLTPDPTHACRFASYETSPGGSLSTVRLWDSRKAGGELASFDVRSGVFGLEWVSGGAAYAKIGVGTRDGVSLWDIIDGREITENGIEEWTTIGDVRNVVKPKHALHSFAFSNSIDKRCSDVLFVVKDGTIGIGPIASRPLLASGTRGDTVIAASSLSILDPDAEDTDRNNIAQDEEDRSDDEDEEFLRSNRFQLHPARVNDILAEASRSRTGSPGSSIYAGRNTGKVRREIAVRMTEDIRDTHDLGWEGWKRVLKADVGCVMRRRAEEGYGLGNMLLNAAIATKFPGHDRLAGIWEFVDHLVNVMDPTTSVTRSTNLTYAGIHAIWTGQDLALFPVSPQSPASTRSHSTLLADLGRPPSQNTTPREPVKQGSAAWTSLRNNQLPTRSQSTPVDTPPPGSHYGDGSREPLPDADFAAAVETMNARRDADDHIGKVGKNRLPPSEKAAQRRMILAVCGEREAGEMHRHVEDDTRTKTASLAYFSGEEENAVRILMNSSNSKHRLLGTTLAGFLSQTRSTRASDFFDEHWRSLINRVDDPYIRAVLSRVGGDGWESVLEEEAIPLLDRTAIAVCNLSDDELTSFLKNRLNRFMRNPSPSLTALAHTGFTSPAIAIMQRWLERTGDIQSVALLSSHFPVDRLSSSEKEAVKRWNESYRDLLDGWGMWGERVEYDIGRMEVGRGLGEKRGSEEEQAGRGTCPVCNNVLSTAHEEHLQLKSGLSRERSLPNERTGACTLCGQTLPRCVICLKHVEARFSTAHRDKDDHDDYHESPLTPSDTIDQAYICCLTCRHGGHANHILPWFQGGLDGEGAHEVCPVAGCACECGNI